MKAKFKLGTVVQLGGGTFTQINGIIINENGVSYQGGAVDNFGEGDVIQAYRPYVARGTRKASLKTSGRSSKKGTSKVLSNGVANTETLGNLQNA